MTKENKDKSLKGNLYRNLGIIIVIFAMIGLISSLQVTWRYGADLLSNRTDKVHYEKFLRPVVMFDPAPFTTPQNADANFILQAAMWSALMGENLENYGYDDIGLLIIPASDLDVEAAKLFGPDVKLEHRTFDDYSVSYLYETEIKAYHVPMEPRTGYTPKVEEISKRNGSIYLKVGYISPDNIWFFRKEDQQVREPDKYMIYELSDTKKGEQHIISVQMLEQGVPMS